MFKMSNYPSVMITLINHNGKEWLQNCLSSTINTDYSNFKIIIIDNASKDGSIPFIKNNFGHIEIIRNRRNIGFSKSVNMGIKIAMARSSKYIVFLNPDIKVFPNWIAELVKVAEDDEDIGILMPLHYNYSGDKLDLNLSRILSNNDQYLKDRAAGNLKERYGVTSAIGGCMMIRKDIIKKVGNMDPIYFTYGEDSDFSRRVIFHGYKIVVATKSKIMHWHRILHKGKISKWVGFLLYRNQLIYFLKDPNRSFLDNLYRYYFNKEEGAWRMIKSWSPTPNWRYLLMIGYFQFWIFFHLAIIFIRHSKDRKKT
jgi:GT2 family glycosyltransferase